MMIQIKKIPVLAIFIFLASCTAQKHTTQTRVENNQQQVFQPDTTAQLENTPKQTFEEEYEKVSPYHPAFTKVNDILHTKLDVRLDWNKQYLYGKEWLTLRPHFYPTDSLTLDAK